MDRIRNKISLIKSRIAELIARKESAPVRLELYWIARDVDELQPVTMRFVTGGVVLTQLDAQYIGLLGAGALAIDGSEGMTTTAKAIKK